MELGKYIIEKFEIFFRRAFLPSLVLYFFILVLDLVFNKSLIFKSLLSYISKNKVENLSIIIFIVFSIGYSYVVSMLSQIIFDNNIKENYETHFFWTKENEILSKLREQIGEKLIRENEKFNELNLNDYLIYDILIKKMEKEERREYQRYVDETKSYGIMYLSFLFALGLLRFKLKFDMCIMIVSIIILAIIICDTIRAKYRSRAIRLYLNYLDKTTKN
jgi:ABC-type multidrug transport system fused ATPase/permease subunit